MTQLDYSILEELEEFNDTCSSSTNLITPKETSFNFHCDINQLLVKSFGAHTYEEKKALSLEEDLHLNYLI